MEYQRRCAYCLRRITQLAAACLGIVILSYQAMAGQQLHTLSIAAEYVTGEYEATEAIDEWYFPVTIKYYTGHYAYRVTVPYLSVSAPAGTTIAGPGGEIIVGDANTRVTESGLGDVIVAASYRDVLNKKALGRFLDITAKIKIASADENRGLGTGENDYSMQADATGFYGRFVPYATLGYTWRGDPPDVDLGNVWFVTLGTKYRYTERFSGSVEGYYRQASYPGTDDHRALTLALDCQLNARRHWGGYLMRGLSDASPDWGVGMQVTTQFGH